jgi:hypothetical protein
MDRQPNETDPEYRARLIDLPIGNLSYADKILLAAKISALGQGIFLSLSHLSLFLLNFTIFIHRITSSYC